VTAALEARAASSVAALIARGPWRHPQQLPRRYIPGLAARPWHSVARHYPHLAPVRAALEDPATVSALVDEYRRLSAGGKLFPETECIHDPKAGAWWHYSVEGPWLRRDADGCSVDAPVACSLLARIKQLQPPPGETQVVRVLRAGYSALAPGAHLHPHSGMTNAQLKFHLGLIVPRAAAPASSATGVGAAAVTAGGDSEGAPCARIRVGNDTRAWRAGRVLFFDDSWEHEVWNECAAERVVFQLVFAHPDLAAAMGGGAGAGAAARAGARAAAAGKEGALAGGLPRPVEKGSHGKEEGSRAGTAANVAADGSTVVVGTGEARDTAFSQLLRSLEQGH
jgi:hypothetical protein